MRASHVLGMWTLAMAGLLEPAAQAMEMEERFARERLQQQGYLLPEPSSRQGSGAAYVKALRIAQQNLGLRVTGKLSEQTLAKLAELPERELVRSIQQALQQLGHDVGGADGIAGPKTQLALNRWGQGQGVDAELDEQTLERLQGYSSSPTVVAEVPIVKPPPIKPAAEPSLPVAVATEQAEPFTRQAFLELFYLDGRVNIPNFATGPSLNGDFAGGVEFSLYPYRNLAVRYFGWSGVFRGTDGTIDYQLDLIRQSLGAGFRWPILEGKQQLDVIGGAGLLVTAGRGEVEFANGQQSEAFGASYSAEPFVTVRYSPISWLEASAEVTYPTGSLADGPKYRLDGTVYFFERVGLSAGWLSFDLDAPTVNNIDLDLYRLGVRFSL